jgi:hypothetical protein
MGDVDMNIRFAALAFALAAAIAATAVTHTSPAEAKGKTFWITKKSGTYKNMPKPYTKGTYRFVCASWGDCGNWNQTGSK